MPLKAKKNMKPKLTMKELKLARWNLVSISFYGKKHVFDNKAKVSNHSLKIIEEERYSSAKINATTTLR